MLTSDAVVHVSVTARNRQTTVLYRTARSMSPLFIHTLF